MEKDFNLHNTVIELIDKQIQQNNPPATNEAYKRLQKKGYDAVTAKEMIASVISEEIYTIMTEHRKFDEEAYSAKLADLE